MQPGKFWGVSERCIYVIQGVLTRPRGDGCTSFNSRGHKGLCSDCPEEDIMLFMNQTVTLSSVNLKVIEANKAGRQSLTEAREMSYQEARVAEQEWIQNLK